VATKGSVGVRRKAQVGKLHRGGLRVKVRDEKGGGKGHRFGETKAPDKIKRIDGGKPDNYRESIERGTTGEKRKGFWGKEPPSGIDPLKKH